MKSRAISYIRWSSPEQARGDSLRRQLHATQAYCKKHKLVLDEQLRDEGVSAFRGRNAETGALSRFLDSVEAGHVPKGSVLIVESLDRLSRDEILPALGIFTRLLSAGIKLVTLGDGREYTAESANKNPMELQFSILELVRSRRESERKSELIEPIWRHKKEQAKRGVIVTRRVPAWLRVVNNRLKHDPMRTLTVQRIVKLAIDGHGATAITQILNREGVPNISTTGKPWSVGTIRKIISNPALVGVYQPMTHRGNQPRRRDGAPVANYFPRVISDEQWHRLRAAQERRRTYISGRAGSTSVPNLFGSLLRCGDDGSVYQLSRKRPGRTLMSCSHGIQGLGRQHHTCSYTDFEREFLDFIGHADLRSQPQPKQRHQALEKDLAEMQSRRVKVEEEIANGGTPAQMDALLSILRRLAENEHRLRTRIDEAHRKAVSPGKDELQELGGVARMRGVTGNALSRLRAKIRDRIASVAERIEVFVREDDHGARRTCLVIVTLREGIKALRGGGNIETFAFQEFPYRQVEVTVPYRAGACIGIGMCPRPRKEAIEWINSEQCRKRPGEKYYNYLRSKKIRISYQDWAEMEYGKRRK